MVVAARHKTNRAGDCPWWEEGKSPRPCKEHLDPKRSSMFCGPHRRELARPLCCSSAERSLRRRTTEHLSGHRRDRARRLQPYPLHPALPGGSMPSAMPDSDPPGFTIAAIACGSALKPDVWTELAGLNGQSQTRAWYLHLSRCGTQSSGGSDT